MRLDLPLYNAAISQVVEEVTLLKMCPWCLRLFIEKTLYIISSFILVGEICGHCVQLLVFIDIVRKKENM